MVHAPRASANAARPEGVRVARTPEAGSRWKGGRAAAGERGASTPALAAALTAADCGCGTSPPGAGRVASLGSGPKRGERAAPTRPIRRFLGGGANAIGRGEGGCTSGSGAIAPECCTGVRTTEQGNVRRRVLTSPTDCCRRQPAGISSCPGAPPAFRARPSLEAQQSFCAARRQIRQRGIEIARLVMTWAGLVFATHVAITHLLRSSRLREVSSRAGTGA